MHHEIVRWLVLLLLGTSLRAANPLYPADYFADPEPHVWADERIYLYCSHDVSADAYCSDNYHVLSSSDLAHWQDHGVSFSLKDAGVVGATALYACDCGFKDGVYHLYASTNNGKIVEASSTSPTGPFTHPHVMTIHGIDPAIFVDDDGQAYLYWGQFDQVRAARLKPDMVEIEPGTEIQPLNVKDDFFHEGSAVVKRKGIYYYVYASTVRKNRPTCLAYATGASPLGPFRYRGVVIDNTGCDAGVWNNHGRIVEFKGQWYVFYHRSTHGTRFMRQSCAEPITFNPDGTIPEVHPTSQGAGSSIQ